MHPETVPPTAPPTHRGGAASFVLPLYVLTLFLSAFLLFAVQPMFTKMVLPLLGGSAAVWNTAVVFFQGTLLLGYFYAHLSSRHLGPRAQVILHAVVLLSAFVFLPIGVAAWQPPAADMQIPWLIGLLAVSIGLPFFAVSATAPLLQKWFAHTDHAAAGDPYFLYGGSNLGSLAALLSYPFVVERLLGLHAQARVWTVGYGMLVLVIGACGVTLVRRWRPVAADVGEGEAGLVREVGWMLRLRWLALSVVPSALLLGTTLHVGNEIAAAPFLWVIPLSLYLLTFVLVFSFPRLVPRVPLLLVQALLLAILASGWEKPNLLLLLLIHIGTMFLTTLVCHAELARLRPTATHLTEFYLWMSIGGVVGGILSAIVAPLVFDSVLEYPLALLAGILLRPKLLRPRRTSSIRMTLLAFGLDLALPGLLYLLLASWAQTMKGAMEDSSLKPEEVTAIVEQMRTLIAWGGGIAIVLLSTRPLRMTLAFLVVLATASPNVLHSPDSQIMRERSFFGVYSVHKLPTPFGLFHFLFNGGVLHGGQNMDRPLGPTTYYVREGPVGQFFDLTKGFPKPVERIACVGLGVGALAPYVGYGQHLTYFEIDPLDEVIARDTRYFTYLPDAGDKIDVKIGDGRLKLEEEPDGAFDLIVVAAFSGDAIPMHLITKEALDLYFRKLAPRGLVLMNVTNAYLDLIPVVGNLAHELGVQARVRLDAQLANAGHFGYTTVGGSPADYVVLGRRPEDLARFGNVRPPWPVLEPDPRKGIWTDDHSDILTALRWSEYSRLAE